MNLRVVARFMLVVYFWAFRRDVPSDAEIRETPSELRPKRRVVVALDSTDDERKMLTDC